MNPFVVSKDALDFRDIDQVLSNKGPVSKLVSSIEKSIKPCYSVRTFQSNDSDINALIQINTAYQEYNANLLALKQTLEPYQQFFNEKTKIMSELFYSFRLNVIEVRKPTKAGFVIALFFLLILLIRIPFTYNSFFQDMFLTSIILATLMLILTLVLFVVYKKSERKYQNYVKNTYPKETSRFQSECIQKWNAKSRTLKREYEGFLSTQVKKVEQIEQEFLLEQQKLEARLQPFQEYARYLQEPKLMVDMLSVIADKRAKTFAEAINTVLDDYHKAELERLQRAQTQLAQDRVNETRTPSGY